MEGFSRKVFPSHGDSELCDLGQIGLFVDGLQDLRRFEESHSEREDIREVARPVISTPPLMGVGFWALRLLAIDTFSEINIIEDDLLLGFIYLEPIRKVRLTT